MSKAWHSHGNTLYEGTDFYPELAEIGNGLIGSYLAIQCYPPLEPA
jgi:hypothetical protein